MCTKTDNLPVVTLNHFIADNFGLVMLPMKGFMERLNHNQRKYRSAFYTIIFCGEGNGYLEVDTNTIIVAKDIALCIKPNSVINIDKQQNLQGFAILFSENFFSLRYNENVLKHFEYLKYNIVFQKQLDTESASEWSFYMKVMEREYTTGGRHALNLLRSYLNIILNTLDSGQAITPQAVWHGEKERKVIVLERLTDQHFTEEKFPSFYAKELRITVNYLNRICKDLRGKSSGTMIRNRVILEAERLLYHTTKTVSEVSADLGFESVSYFTTFFKKDVGMTPESFRKKMSGLG